VPGKTKTSPFPWECEPPSNAPMPGATTLTALNGSSIASALSHNYATVPIVYNGTPHIHPKTAPAHAPASSFDPADPSYQTASRSSQPFCHNPPNRPTDSLTDNDRWSRRQTCTNTRLRSINDSDAANNNNDDDNESTCIVPWVQGYRGAKTYICSNKMVIITGVSPFAMS